MMEHVENVIEAQEWQILTWTEEGFTEALQRKTHQDGAFECECSWFSQQDHKCDEGSF